MLKETYASELRRFTLSIQPWTTAPKVRGWSREVRRDQAPPLFSGSPPHRVPARWQTFVDLATTAMPHLEELRVAGYQPFEWTREEIEGHC